MFHPAGGRVCLLPAHRAAPAAPRPEAILPRVRKWSTVSWRPAYVADSDPIVSGMTLPESDQDALKIKSPVPGFHRVFYFI